MESSERDGQFNISGIIEKSTAILESTLICPACGHVERETMPTDACQWFYDCKGCGAVLKPKLGDCCVFCSYGDIPCPPMQAGDDGCCARGLKSERTQC